MKSEPLRSTIEWNCPFFKNSAITVFPGIVYVKTGFTLDLKISEISKISKILFHKLEEKVWIILI